MSRVGRVYRRTESGQKALSNSDASLSVEQREILGLIEADTHWDEIRKLLRRNADYQRLAELEAGGLIVSEAAKPDSDLDFTGNFVFR